ncbi:MAG: HAMP domain-containing sensor histidine kinase [Acidimicrobiia bacterium]
MPQAVGALVASGTANVSPRKPLRVYASAACFLMLVAAAIITVLDPQNDEVGPIAVMVGSLVSGILVLRGSRAYVDRERLAWRLVGGGFVYIALAVLVYAVLSTVLVLPAFGPYDLVFLSAYGITLTGFALMPHLGSVLRSRARVILDGVIGATAMATLVWVLFLPSLQAHLTSATIWERFAGVAYPVIDTVAVVVALIVTIRRSAWRFDIRIVLLGVGMLVQVVGDLSLMSSGVGQTFANAEPNFLFFILAQMCYLGVGTWIGHRPKPREYADKRQGLWPMLAPYAAVVLLAWLVGTKLIESTLAPDTLALLAIAVVIVALVIIRQTVALKEYHVLVEQRRKALVASVSHELRTPLTAMVGFLDVMKDPNVSIGDEERHELTGVVHQQAMYMSRIVADLLLLARDSAGPDLRESVVKIEKLVNDSVWSGRSTPVGLEVEVEPGLSAYLDPDRMRQVLDNLVTNAIRYGRGNVLVTAGALEGDIVFEVHDDGPGIPRKYELAIWEQFERGPNRLNANVPGSGIGLAVVDLIVRRHGGTASHERSKRLGGACFRVILPRRHRSAPAPASRPEGLHASVPAQ